MLRESRGQCVVCGAKDARALVMVELSGGEAALLCGSHALMHARHAVRATNVEELRAALRDRRLADRRLTGGDELAERLTAAFSRDRRGVDRRLTST